MQLQVVAVLRRPAYALAALAMAAILSLVFLYLDEFYFVSPYLVADIDRTRLPVLLIDFGLSMLAGVALTLSVYEIRVYPQFRGSYRKTGATGIVAALVAGACPCYYLVPLTAALGGTGGILSTLGLVFFDYQIPIKLGSLGLLALTGYAHERGLRAACAIESSPTD